MIFTPSSFALSNLLPGFGAGEDVIGFFAYAAGDVTAERFDFFGGFFARHRRQRAGQNKSFAGQRKFTLLFSPRLFRSSARCRVRLIAVRSFCQLLKRKSSKHSVQLLARLRSRYRLCLLCSSTVSQIPI